VSYFEEGLSTYLKAHAGLVALVSTRIYPDLMPEETTGDCVTWQVLPGRELHVGNYVEPTLIIKSWARATETRPSARLATIAIDHQVRAALEAFHGAMGDFHVRVMTEPRGDDYEPETGWHSRIRLASPLYRES
jgi:hypothetical protein